MAGHVTTLPPSLKTLRLFVHELRVIKFPIDYHWRCVRGHCACAESRDPRVGGKNNYIFGIPDPDLPIHYTTFIGLRRRLRVVYSRAVPCKPFSGHLAAILFYANYKVKTQNSAWELGSSHSACLNYVKKSRSPLLPQNAPNIHSSKKCV